MPKPPSDTHNATEDDGPTAAEVAAQARALRGAARLAVETTNAVAGLVDAVHARVANPHGPTDGDARGVARAVGNVDTLLAALIPALAPRPGTEPTWPAFEREAILAALNGVMGDRLATTANPLAIRMAWRHAGRTLPRHRAALETALPQIGEKLLVLVHDLCMNDLQWRRADGHDHGQALAAALGFTPVYLHYDSGLHVSTNGRALAGQLAQLLEAWPRPIARFALVAHGAGGLVARSALHYGRADGLHWPDRLDDIAFLGTPHHGAPLDDKGMGIAPLLESTPCAGSLDRLSRLGSAGIADLRRGNLVDEDWLAGDRAGSATDRRTGVPLPAGPRCYAIAGATDSQDGSKDKVSGDGLVPVASALGKHRLARRTLKFPAAHQRVFERTSHSQLLSSLEVFDQLRDWLGH